MAWDPDTNAEQAEAERFYEAAHWKSWTTPADLQRLLRPKGLWLIRWNLLGRYEFLTTKDEHLVFGPGDGDFFLFHSEPSKAVQVTSEEALHLIPRLMKDFGGWIFEPVKPEQAMNDLRPTTRNKLPSAGLPVRVPGKQSSEGSASTKTQDLIERLMSGPTKETVLELYEDAKRLQEDLRNSPPPGFIIPE
jgi:hypothetical protein